MQHDNNPHENVLYEKRPLKEGQQVRSPDLTKRLTSIVELNVGGEIYATTVETLTRCPNSMLESMFAQRNAAMLARDQRGRCFIDRDGKLFRYVLNFLRDGRLTVGEDFRDLEALRIESEYFALDAMKEQILALQKACERSKREATKHLERAMVSALTQHCCNLKASQRSTPGSPPRVPTTGGLQRLPMEDQTPPSPTRSTNSNPARLRPRRQRTISLDSDPSTFSDMSYDESDSIHFDETLFDNVPDF